MRDLTDRQDKVFYYLYGKRRATTTQVDKALDLEAHASRHTLQSLALKGLVFYSKDTGHWHSAISHHQDAKKWMLGHLWSELGNETFLQQQREQGVL